MRILLLSGLLMGWGAGEAVACSCGSWSSFYRGAHLDGSQVAVLKTQKTVGRGEIRASVVDVYKGDAVAVGDQITLFGQDGLNCLGTLVHDTETQWIALFRKDDEGKLHTLSCAATALKLESGEVAGSLFDKGDVTVLKSDLEALLAGKARPTQTLTCSLSVTDSRDGYESVQERGESALPASLTLKKQVQAGGKTYPLWLNAQMGRDARSLRLGYRNPVDGYAVRSEHLVDAMAPAPHVRSSVSSSDFKVNVGAECSVLHDLPLY